MAEAGADADRVDKRRLELRRQLCALDNLRQRALRYLRNRKQRKIQILDSASRVGIVHQRVDQRFVALKPRRQRRTDGERRRRRANQGGNAQHPADKSPVHAEDDAHPQHSQNDDIHDIHAFSFRRPRQVGSSTT